MSDKNIPISENLQEFRIQTIKSVTKFATNVRWTVKAALNPHKFGKRKETFGFKTVKVCTQVPELKEFERGLFELTKNIKQRVIRCQGKSDFQKKLSENIQRVKSESRMFVKADKSSNYRVSQKKHSYKIFGLEIMLFT